MLPETPLFLFVFFYLGITTAAKPAQYFINVARAIACMF